MDLIRTKDESEDIAIPNEGMGNMYTHFLKRLSEKNWFSFWGPVDEASCELCALFLMDAMLREEKEVNLLICSGGGSEDDSRALTGVMELCKANGMVIRTYGAGCIASAALDIFIACTKGYRFAFEVTIFMTHSSDFEGNKALFELSQKFDEWTLKKYTGIHAATRRRFMETGDWYFDSDQAVDYGVVDCVIYPGKKLPDGPVYPKRKTSDQQKKEAAAAEAED